MRGLSSAFLEAVQYGDHERVKKLVFIWGLQKTRSHSEGCLLLTKALFFGHEDIAKFLLDNGAKPVCSRKGANYKELPLHMACRRNYKDIVVKCLQRGSDPNKLDNRRRTPIFYVRDVEIAKALLLSGAQINLRDKWKHTPLYVILKRVHSSKDTTRDLLQLFKNNGFRFHSNEAHSLLCFLMERCNQPTFRELIRYKLDDRAKNMALSVAHSRGLSWAYKTLVADGAIIVGEHKSYIYDKRGNSSFELASNALLNFEEYNEDSSIFRRPERGTNNKFGKFETGTLLHRAMENKDNRMISALLKQGFDPCALNSHGQTPFYVAARKGDLDMLKIFLDHGTKIDRTFRDGTTPLHLALDNQGECCGILSILIPYMKRTMQDFDIDLLDANFETPLLKAIRRYGTREGIHTYFPLILNGASLEKAHYLNPRALGGALPSGGIYDYIVVALQEANLPNSLHLCKKGNADSLSYECKREKIMMNEFKIVGTKSLYDYLHDSDPFTVEAIGDLGHRLEEFPFYRGIIEAKIWKDRIHVDLWREGAQKAFDCRVESRKRHKILSSLTFPDLIDFIRFSRRLNRN